jgi:hypothetical protein
MRSSRPDQTSAGFASFQVFTSVGGGGRATASRRCLILPLPIPEIIKGSVNDENPSSSALSVELTRAFLTNTHGQGVPHDSTHAKRHLSRVWIRPSLEVSRLRYECQSTGQRAAIPPSFRQELSQRRAAGQAATALAKRRLDRFPRFAGAAQADPEFS